MESKQLITVDANGKLQLENEGAQMLKTALHPLWVVAVAGKARTVRNYSFRAKAQS